MRHLTRFVATLLIGASLPVVPTMAQDPEPGTSFTDRIVNPGFDDKNSNGWELTGGSGGFDYGVMEVYNADFNLSQTITDLPPGTYRLTVDGFQRPTWNDGGAAYNNRTERITLFLYGNSSKWEKQTAFHSLYSVTGLESPNEGFEPNLNGFMNNMYAASWAFENGHYLNNTVDDIVVEEDGILTIGIKTEGTKLEGCWAIFDNFTLTYTGEDGLDTYRRTIDNLLGDLTTYGSGNSSIPSGIYEDIRLVEAYSQENYSSSDTEVLLDVIDSLTSVLTRVEEVVPVMETLYDGIEDAYYYLSLNYPGADVLDEVINKMLDLIEKNATTENGDYVYQKDIEEAIAELKTAIRDYRFTQPITNPAQGVDFTWVLQSPQFTREGGDPSVADDESSEGWATNNDPATHSEYRLNHINGKNCWNNWNDNFVSMDVYQILEGMPLGLYSFECYQTNDGPEVTDQHAYISALGGIKNSPYATYTFADDSDGDAFGTDSKWEGPLQTAKVLVGENGEIRVGFASTSNGNGSSGWFCFTDCKLTYYGEADNMYEDAMAQLIESAKEMLNEEMLISNYNALSAAIATAEEVDATNNEAAIAGMEALNKVLDATSEGIRELAAFKSGSYAKAIEITDDNEGIYSEEIINLMADVVISINDQLDSSATLTTEDLADITADLDQYLAYVSAYQSCEEAAVYTFSTAVATLIQQMLAAQTAEVSDSFDNIDEAIATVKAYTAFAEAYSATFDYAENEPDYDIKMLVTSVLEDQADKVLNEEIDIDQATATFDAIVSFSKIYVLAMDFAYNEEYPQDLLAKLASTCMEQYEIVLDDASTAAEAEKVISVALADMRFSGIGLVPGDDTEVSFVIVNPDTDSTGQNDPVEGWTIEQTDGNANTNVGQHWSGDLTARYLDSWNATAGRLKFTALQEIKGIPNGIYRLVAAGRTSGEGAYLYAANSEQTKATEMMPINYDTGGEIWENAEEDSEIKLAHEGTGWGWNWVEVTDINVNTYSLTIGVSNVPEITQGNAFTGTWYSATNFKLFWISDKFTGVGIEEVNADSDSPLVAYAENGYIVVPGVEEYTIYTLNGIQIPANAQLTSGIYIVKAANRVAKVAVK